MDVCRKIGTVVVVTLVSACILMTTAALVAAYWKEGASLDDLIKNGTSEMMRHFTGPQLKP